MATFVLEIGTEELPARFLAREQAELLSRFETELAAANLAHGNMRAMASPRRLVLVIEDLAARQPVSEVTVVGPPLNRAYNEDGSPSKALAGFMQGQGVDIAAIRTVSTEKGEYVACVKATGGLPAARVLASICPSVIAALPFAKRMRWGSQTFSYARPIRWILALLDETVVPFEVGGKSSGNQTYGHRVHGAGPFTVPKAADYSNISAAKSRVVADQDVRRESVIQGGNAQAAEVNGAVIWNDGLLDEVCGLVEHPVPMLGAFDEKYLEMPEEVLLTSMQTHQKSFGIRGNDGRLLPYFLTVLNIDPVDPALVRSGWEKVLRARLEDARFFWNGDLATPLANWLEKLEHVIFIGSLGSMADRTRRLADLASWLAEQVCPLEAKVARRAAELAKADLVSGMVGEFDTLQGIMGGIYARLQGENPEVARAIATQYLPAGPDTPLPDSPAGAVLSIADKADTLAGCFGLDMIPGGAADPNGLRRCALGIIRILLARQWFIDADRIFERALGLYGDREWKLAPVEALAKLHDFFIGRMRSWFIAQGHDTMQVDAVLETGSANVADCAARLEALAAFSRAPAYLKSAQILKRIENISRKTEETQAGWDEKSLQEQAEIELAAVLSERLPRLDGMLAARDYAGGLKLLETLIEPVDAFFDQVMVMSEDENARKNRLGLLNALSSRYKQIAAFSLLQI